MSRQLMSSPSLSVPLCSSQFGIAGAQRHRSLVNKAPFPRFDLQAEMILMPSCIFVIISLLLACSIRLLSRNCNSSRPLALLFFAHLFLRFCLFFLQVTAEQLLQLLNPVAEVKYIRMTGRESDMVKTALVEFSEQPGLHRVFGLNGSLLNNRPIMWAYIRCLFMHVRYTLYWKLRDTLQEAILSESGMMGLVVGKLQILYSKIFSKIFKNFINNLIQSLTSF